MISSRSPRDVARVALAAGKEAFSDYSHICSPHKFTQPQLFACMVLKEFEKKDYRGIWQLLKEFTDLRHVMGLKSVPHFTTLQKASRRLLKAAPVRELIASTVRQINGRPGDRPAAANPLDSNFFCQFAPGDHAAIVGPSRSIRTSFPDTGCTGMKVEQLSPHPEKIYLTRAEAHYRFAM